MAVQFRMQDKVATASAEAPEIATALANSAKPGGRVAYLINQYPKVSHSFIRREILAHEAAGLSVFRLAVRGWDADVVDPDDIAEKQRTRYLLKNGVGSLLLSALRVGARRPTKIWRAVRTALQLSRNSDRSWPYYLVYVLEACRAVEALEEDGAAHVHAHFGTNSTEVALLIHLIGGQTYSFTVHGSDEFDGGRRLGFDVKVRHAKFVVAVSSFTRSQIYRFIDPADWTKVEVVHCGLDRSFIAGPARALPSEFRLVCVGRFCEEKGQIILLEALAKVRAGGLDCRLTLAGDGPMRGVIESRIAALGLAHAVEITGWISSGEVRRRILAARALVCSSFMEGLPVVIMEGMALRRPVIASAVAGIPELVVDGDTGWLVAPGEPSALATAIAACLTLPEPAMSALTERAYDRVVERHSIEREARKLARLFGEPVDGTSDA